MTNELPSVAASATPATTRKGAPVGFTADASDPDGAVEKVLWDFGDGTTAIGLQPPAFAVSHAYAQADIFTVTATAVDDRGGTATGSVNVEVRDVDAPVITLDAIELLGTVDDPAVSEVSVSVDGGAAESVLVQTMSFTKEVAVSTVGPTTVEIDAQDAYGNPASISLTITVSSP